jgi:hypothetical protein
MRLKDRPIPPQEVVRWQGQLIVVFSGRKVRNPPVRGLALAIDTEACAFGLDDEPVMHQLAKPVGYIAPVLVAKVFLGVALTEIDVAVIVDAAGR